MWSTTQVGKVGFKVYLLSIQSRNTRNSGRYHRSSKRIVDKSPNGDQDIKHLWKVKEVNDHQTLK